MHLLQGLRRNVDSIPAAIRVDFTSVVDDLIRVAQPGVRLTSAAITIALGPMYQDTIPLDESSVDSAFFASAPLPILRPYRDLRSSTDSRRSSSDTAMQSFVPFPGSVESAFTARQDVCPDSRPDPRHTTLKADTRPDMHQDSRQWDRQRQDSSSDRLRRSVPDRPPSAPPSRLDDEHFQEIERAHLGVRPRGYLRICWDMIGYVRI